MGSSMATAEARIARRLRPFFRSVGRVEELVPDLEWVEVETLGDVMLLLDDPPPWFPAARCFIGEEEEEADDCCWGDDCCWMEPLLDPPAINIIL